MEEVERRPVNISGVVIHVGGNLNGGNGLVALNGKNRSGLVFKKKPQLKRFKQGVGVM